MGTNRYKNTVRLRIAGLLVRDDAILLVQIHSPVTDSLVWIPPGGGLQFGEQLKHCLEREFAEETGCTITVGTFIGINELIQPPFHAVECYYAVKWKSGTPILGSDPEHADDQQLLNDIAWIPLNELNCINHAPKQLSRWSQHIAIN